jgi:hypothetical protein
VDTANTHAIAFDCLGTADRVHTPEAFVDRVMEMVGERRK